MNRRSKDISNRENFMALVGTANETNRLASGYQVEIDEQLRRRSVPFILGITAGRSALSACPPLGAEGSGPMAHKIGPNDPCPCGSGRKYKRCHGLSRAITRAAVGSGAAAIADPPRRRKPFSELAQIEVERRREIERIFRDEFAFIDDCLALAAMQVELLGDTPPSSVEDVGMRDLRCDAFAFPYEVREAIARNNPSVVFPLMRRAFEVISLCHLFTVKPEFARKWSKGKDIRNSDVSRHLEHDPLTESVDQLREEYRYFSEGTILIEALSPYCS